MRQGIYRKGKKMRKISLKRFLFIHLPVAAAVIIYILLPIKCPFKYFFHFNCPTCGMTRAMLSLFKGDIASYISYNPMALPFLSALLLGFHIRVLPIKKRVSEAVIITVGVLTLAVNFLK